MSFEWSNVAISVCSLFVCSSVSVFVHQRLSSYARTFVRCFFFNRSFVSAFICPPVHSSSAFVRVTARSLLYLFKSSVSFLRSKMSSVIVHIAHNKRLVGLLQARQLVSETSDPFERQPVWHTVIIHWTANHDCRVGLDDDKHEEVTQFKHFTYNVKWAMSQYFHSFYWSGRITSLWRNLKIIVS